MSIVGAVVMMVCGVGAVVGYRQSNAGVSWGRPVALGSATLALVLALWGMVPKGGDPVEHATRHNHAAGKAMGEHLADRHPGSRVLVLLPPAVGQARLNDMEAALLGGFNQGVGRDLEVVGEIPLEPPAALKAGAVEGEPPPYEVMGVEGWFTSREMIRFLEVHKGTFDILVLLVGLPGDFSASGIERYPDLPDIALLQTPMFGSREMVESGLVDAMVMRNPDTASAQASLLVTPDNVRDLAATYPSLF